MLAFLGSGFDYLGGTLGVVALMSCDIYSGQ